MEKDQRNTVLGWIFDWRREGRRFRFRQSRTKARDFD